MSDPRFRLSYENPFATPAGERNPARRLRGRLAAPVTLWTAGRGPQRAGLTVSSVLLAEGDPALVAGVIGPLSDLAEQIQSTGRFVVHVLGEHDRRLADIFAGVYPSPGGPFAGLDTGDSEWGPVLAGSRTTAFCDLASAAPAGWQQLVTATAARIDLAEEAATPLVHYRGRYRYLRPER